MTDGDAEDDAGLTIDAFHEALQDLGSPVVTAADVARTLDLTHEEADRGLAALAEEGAVGRRDVEADPVVWYPIGWEERVDRERVIPFPERRELVVEHPEQFTRARLSQFAYLVDATGRDAYLYRIREEDVWGAPYDDLDELLSVVRRVLPEREPDLEEWIERQWKRARQFTLYTHEDGYTVIAADSEGLMGNVARRKLDEDHLHAPISDTESWVVEGSEAEIKRILYDAGYPVRDERDLDPGDALDVDLRTELRDYQREWVERFLDRQAGVLVGPPGSGKTIAALGVVEAIGGETLVLVPSRELAGQWRESMLAHTTLAPEQIGEYHGGEKEIEPVTIATYQTAGMDRHRQLFDSRRWGLIVYDECLTGDTVVETPDGKTTFAELDDRFDLDAGWNTDLDIRVRTYRPETGSYAWDDVTGCYKTTAPTMKVTTNTGRTIRTTAGHTHLVFDPDTCELVEQTGIEEGDFLLVPGSTGTPATSVPVGPVLSKLKRDLGLTEAELAEMCGVSCATIGGVIRGRYRLGQHRLQSLAESLRTYAEEPCEQPHATRERFNVTYETLGAAVGATADGGCSRFQRRESDVTDALDRILRTKRRRVREYARRLEKLQGVTVLEVDAVEPDGVRTVYDFETESHTFLADGFLTHNCQHIPSPVFRRSTDLQSKHRLGLSVHGDSVLPVKRGDTIAMERIEAFATKHLGEEAGVASTNGAETLAVTSTGDVTWTTITAVMRHEHGDEMYTVRARNGRKVTVTEDHSLMVFCAETGRISSKRPDELSDSDYLLQPCISSRNPDGKSQIDVMELMDEGYVLLREDAPDAVFEPLYRNGIGSTRDRYNWKRRKSLPLSVAREVKIDNRWIKGVYVHKRDKYIPPTVPIEVFARLVGLFVADGAFGDHRIEFYATDTEEHSEVREFKELIHALCPEAEISTTQNGENCTTVRISGPLVQIFRNMSLSNGARKKEVPPLILSNPRAYEPFIEGLTIGDGNVQKRERNREMVTISTSSDRLAQGVNFILSRLGLVGGNYRRTCDVEVREGKHDVVENNLVRFNPKNRAKRPRNALIPFTASLRETYNSIERIPRTERSNTIVKYPLVAGLDHRQRLTTGELATLRHRARVDEYEWLENTDVAFLEIDSIERAESAEYVYDISTKQENFLGNHLFCHNSATPVREDDREREIFTLIGPPIGTDWTALFDAGFVARPEVELRYVPWGSEEARNEYGSAEGHERRQLAAMNPGKLAEIRALLDEHADEKVLVFVDWLDQGRAYEEALGVPFVSGETRYAVRERLFSEFRRGERRTLVISRVGDEGIDLPDASVAIIASGLGGSRRQGAQRAGRTMRPVGGAQVYVLATRSTVEEEFARGQLRHLQARGIHVIETDAETSE